MAYVKNVLNKDNITGAFLNSDDSGLTTNIFLNEPRLYGLRITKDFAGGPWWTGANLDHNGPWPLTVELGGELQHTDAPYERLHADWVDNLPASIAAQNVQNRNLDRGDERSLKVTYRPTASSWSVSADFRYGRTNNETARDSASNIESVHVCAWPSWTVYASACEPPYLFFGRYARYFGYMETPLWSDMEARSHEKHEIADLTAAYRLGLPAGLQSYVSAGLRYADFQSDTHWAANAQTNWNIPDGWRFAFADPSLQGSVDRFHLSMDARREFKGAGPIVSWDGAMSVWGDDKTGHLNVDASVTAGALFGSRHTTLTGEDQTEFQQGNLAVATGFNSETSFIQSTLPVVSTTTAPIRINRSQDATVPVLDLSLGLSYDVGRIKVGTGYRWERYFDALDVGQDAAKKADRTFDGPYLKVAVGFGG